MDQGMCLFALVPVAGLCGPRSYRLAGDGIILIRQRFGKLAASLCHIHDLKTPSPANRLRVTAPGLVAP